MLAEARQALPALKARATTPSGEMGVTRVIGSRFAIYPQREMSVAESTAWWSDYFDVLADLPEGALEAGMKVWIRNPANEFLPKPGQLRGLALTTENRDARAYERARKASEYQPPKVYDNTHVPNVEPRIMRQEPTEADKARVRQWAADFASQIPSAVVVEPRANHGVVDERGVTPEMRAVIARQQGERA